MKIGIFGGTFDPFTQAHKEIVTAALQSHKVDRVVIIPTIVNYYRKDKTSMFTFADRLEFIREWFKDDQYANDIIIDDSEYQLAAAQGKLDDKYEAKIMFRRYVNTLLDAMARYGQQQEYVTIIGEDSLTAFKTWTAHEIILANSSVLAVARASMSLKSMPDVGFPYDSIMISSKLALISSSKVRKALNMLTSLSGFSCDDSVVTELVGTFKRQLSPKETYLKYIRMLKLITT